MSISVSFNLSLKWGEEVIDINKPVCIETETSSNIVQLTFENDYIMSVDTDNLYFDFNGHEVCLSDIEEITKMYNVEDKKYFTLLGMRYIE